MVSLCSDLARKQEGRRILKTLFCRAAMTMCVLLGLLTMSTDARALDTNALLGSWFAAQTNMHTWAADFVQTRTLKTLSQPLTAPGKIWFEAPDTFRWEIGNPPQSIAMRKDDQLLVIYPRLKRVERYALASKAFGQWRGALALLDAGFPRDRAQLEAHFNIAKIAETDGGFQMTLQPKSPSARQFMTQIELVFRTNPFSMVSIDVKFSDGSSMRNDFKNEQLNPVIPPKTFDTTPEPGFTVVEPLGH